MPSWCVRWQYYLYIYLSTLFSNTYHLCTFVYQRVMLCYADVCINIRRCARPTGCIIFVSSRSRSLDGMYDGTWVTCVHVVRISCSSNTQYSAKWLLRNADRLPQHPTLPLSDERIITWTIIMPYRWHFNRAYNALHFVSPNKSALRKCRLYAFLSWWATTLNTSDDSSSFIARDVVENCE